MGLVFNPFTGNFDFTGTSGGGGGSISGTIAAPQVAFGTGVDTIGGDSAFTFDALTKFASVGGGIGVGGTTYTVGDNYTFFFPNLPVNATYWETRLTGTADYLAAMGAAAFIENTADNAAAIFTAYYFDAFVTASHNALYVSGHDFTTYLDTAAGKTVGTANLNLFDPVLTGGGTVSVFSAVSGAMTVDATQLGTAAWLHIGLPEFSSGAAIGTWYAIAADDISGLTVGAAKGFINYADKFIVDSAGSVTAKDFIVSGSAFKTDTTNGHTGLFQAYDVDGAAYKTFATLTNANTPSFALAAPAGGLLTGDFSTLQVGGVNVLDETARVETLAWLGL